VVSTAILAAIGNGFAFRKGREFAAWVGVVPRQYSTGTKPRLLGISKRGNVSLRKILINGARAAVSRMNGTGYPSAHGLIGFDARASNNVVAVAVANKLARIACAVLQRERLSTNSRTRTEQRGKDACGLEALKRSHFPALRQSKLFHQVCTGSKDERTVTTACPEPMPRMVINDCRAY